jgi:hypothetical protein
MNANRFLVRCSAVNYQTVFQSLGFAATLLLLLPPFGPTAFVAFRAIFCRETLRPSGSLLATACQVDPLRIILSDIDTFVR